MTHLITIRQSDEVQDIPTIQIRWRNWYIACQIGHVSFTPTPTRPTLWWWIISALRMKCFNGMAFVLLPKYVTQRFHQRVNGFYDEILNVFSCRKKLYLDLTEPRVVSSWDHNDQKVNIHSDNVLFWNRWQATGWIRSFVSLPWWRHQMEAFSALLALCAVNSPVTGEFPTQRPVTRSFDVFFDPRLSKTVD